MSDEKRIERLTELARKAWPSEHAECQANAWANQSDTAAGVNDPTGHTLALIMDIPNALDALEAALLVLNGPEALREFAYAVVSREGLVSARETLLNKRLAQIHEVLVMDAGDSGPWINDAVRNVLDGNCDNFDPGAWDHAQYPKMEPPQ